MIIFNTNFMPTSEAAKDSFYSSKLFPLFTALCRTYGFLLHFVKHIRYIIVFFPCRVRHAKLAENDSFMLNAIAFFARKRVSEFCFSICCIFSKFF